MRHLAASLFTASLLLAVLVPARPTELVAQTTLEVFVDSIATEHVEAGRIAGMVVGVTRGADTLLYGGYGYADLEWDVPMPRDAVFEIGSVTKQFTSVAILQLWQNGKIDLDADLTTYLPDYDTQGRSIPVRRLLDHTSGIKGYTEMQAFGPIIPQDLPRDTLVALFEAEPLEFEPGHALIYNNSAYFLLGLIIEEVSGQSYEDYLEEHVFPLADMDDSSYCSNDAVVEQRAHGYAPGRAALERADYLDHTWPYSAGSLCSTVGDLLSWVRALHDGEVVSDDAYRRLTVPAPLADGTPVRYAMGINDRQTRSGRVIGHGGGINGFLSETRYYPEEDAIIVVLINTTGPPGPAAVADAIGEHLFGDDHLPAPGTYTGDLGLLEGRYRGAARGQELTVAVDVEDGALTYQVGMGDAQTLEHLEGTTFFRGTFHFTFELGDGPADALRMDQVGGHYVLKRVGEEEAAGVEVPLSTLESYVGGYALNAMIRMEITLEDGQLYAQPVGGPEQPKVPLVADSPTEFHLQMIDAGVEFVVTGDGSVEAIMVRQGDRTQRAERIGG